MPVALLINTAYEDPACFDMPTLLHILKQRLLCFNTEGNTRLCLFYHIHSKAAHRPRTSKSRKDKLMLLHTISHLLKTPPAQARGVLSVGSTLPTCLV